MSTKRTASPKKNEVLLLTCGTVIDKTRMRSLADDFLGYVIEGKDGHYFRVMRTRISGKKIFGVCEAVKEYGGMFY